MSTAGWISRKVSKLLPNGSNNNAAKDNAAKDSAAKDNAVIDNAAIHNVSSGLQALNKEKKVPLSHVDIAKSAISLDQPRATQDRLKGHLRHGSEALSPRVLRRLLDELKAIVDPQISEVEGGRRAQGMAGWYARATASERHDMWLLMSEQFVADPEATKNAQVEFAAKVGTPDEAAAEVHYRRATVSPRRRLLQRISAFPEGIRFLVDLRADMLAHLKADRRLQALDVEMEYMFSTWFDVGFLDLQRISWHSPASLI